ncbi:hypothetical protein GCM10011354_28440 [Egicoccus halophilus]|uniref:Uncharacterized protein n=1 Tax=Egicoccus halophilus TaxID=1670830 RepID=A0A8J3A9R0_9ACTN|nr:hypothetical protein GCM10011354_28440 [Egicoccus halophilus]
MAFAVRRRAIRSLRPRSTVAIRRTPLCGSATPAPKSRLQAGFKLASGHNARARDIRSGGRGEPAARFHVGPRRGPAMVPSPRDLRPCQWSGAGVRLGESGQEITP